MVFGLKALDLSLISWVAADFTIGIIRSNIDGEILDERIIEYWRSCL